MGSELRTQRIIPPYLGLDHASAPELVAPEKALTHNDWLLDRPGKCVMRGPLRRAPAGGLTRGDGTRNLVGTAVWDDKIMWHHADANAGLAIGPWESFWRHASAESDLLTVTVGTGRTRISDLVAATTTDFNVASAYDVGWGRGTRLGNYHYLPTLTTAPAVPASSQLGHLRKETTITIWNGLGVASGPLAAATDVPNFTIATRSHYSRLFACAARDPSAAAALVNYTVAYNPHQIYWTNPLTGSAFPGAFTDWRNPNTLAINKLTVGQQDRGDACLGLAKVGRDLAIFKRHSVHMLYGYSEDTWATRQVSASLGCIDPHSIVEMGGAVYFMSDQGFYQYDGTRFTNVSEAVQPVLLRYALAACGPGGAAGGYVRASMMPNGYIHVVIGTQSFNSGTHTPDFQGYYCPATGGWSNLSVNASALYNNQAVFGVVDTANFWIPFSPQAYWQAPHIFMPEQASSGAYGSDEHPVNLGVRGLTQPQFASRLYSLASPVWSSQLQRVLMDYHYKLAAGGDGSRAAWNVQLINGASEVLAAAYDVPATGATASPNLRRRRHRQEAFSLSNNAADAIALVTRPETDPDATVSAAEVYPLDVVYQTSQERGTQ